MKKTKALRQFILFSVILWAVVAGGNAARAVDTAGKATLTVTANGTGHGTFSPNYNGKSLNIDQNYTIRAVAAAGCEFSQWIINSTNISTNTTARLAFQMVSNLQLTATFLDIKAPTVTITTKKSTGSNSVVAISGTAKDNVGVTAVWCQVGSNGWNLASTGNEYTNWTAYVLLDPGANIVEVYAEDAAGNLSKTNSVTLGDASTGLAPETVAGTMLELETSNQSAALSFGGGTFSQMGSNGVSSGVGNYTYTLQGPDTAQLATAFTAPPASVSNNQGGEITSLVFTNGTSGTWTNIDTNSGTFTLSEASSTVPDLISGLTLQQPDSGSNAYPFTNNYGDGTFTSTDTNGNSSGTYTFAPFSPTVGLAQEIFTNGADSDTTNYVLLNFSMVSNFYYVEADTTNGAYTNGGAFTASEGTNTNAYVAPESLAGLVGAVTEVSSTHGRRSFEFSFGAGTFGQFTSSTDGDGGVGTFTYTRTGSKTALFLNTYVSPPDAVSNNDSGPVAFYFTSSHGGTFTNSDGHGTITFSEPAGTVPLSLEGRELFGHPRDGSRAGTATFHNGMFVGGAGSAGSTGTYTYSVYGPQAALVTRYFTDPSEAGMINYLELWFSSAAGGSFREDDGTGNISTGTFTIK